MYMGERENGKYVIYPRGGKEIVVYCDFTTNGGGWTVIQRRNKGDTLFPTSEESYNNGFGPVDGEFWLGNKKIHQLGRGQMMAVVYENSTSYFYDLYSEFYVLHNSMLDISGRSGMLPEGFLNSDIDGPLLFVAPKASKFSSDCVSSSDGGWWFRGNCGGKNLNAERKECGKSWLGTEMLFRQREPCKSYLSRKDNIYVLIHSSKENGLNPAVSLYVNRGTGTTGSLEAATLCLQGRTGATLCPLLPCHSIIHPPFRLNFQLTAILLLICLLFALKLTDSIISLG